MTLTRHTAALDALGRIENVKHALARLQQTTQELDLWQPAAALNKQCREAQSIIAQLAERLDRKLVVTIIGPSGAGKSTLLNALAGADDISKMGHVRPTTRHLMLVCRDKSDAEPLWATLDPEKVQLVPRPGASALDDIVLIDSPDTDSTAQATHLPLIRQAVSISDILLCVFNAENPKSADHLDLMAPYTEWFRGEALIGVLNKCDRLDEKELKESIYPEFLQHLKDAWPKPASQLFCISARSHLEDPGWDSQIKPRHRFDQFDALKRHISETFGRSGYVIDTRVQNARSLEAYLFRRAEEEIAKDAPSLSLAVRAMQEVEQKATAAALDTMRKGSGPQMPAVNVLLYQILAQRWLGPVGWLIAVWARLQGFGMGLVNLFRFGNPLRQWMGSDAAGQPKGGHASGESAENTRFAANAYHMYRQVLLQRWPDIAEQLVAARFDPTVRNPEKYVALDAGTSRAMADAWQASLESAIDNRARQLSSPLLQLLLNAPVLFLLGHAGWITARNYFTAQYLSGGFFVHTLVTVLFTLFLSFFLFQFLVRFVGGAKRLKTRAFEEIKSHLAQIRPHALNPVRDQAQTMLSIFSVANRDDRAEALPPGSSS
jgi:GTPase SAR1 family protein